MPLPTSINSKAIYHVEAHQLDKWSCGYNALFNACNLEQAIGLDNPCSKFEKFSEICTAFIQRKKRKSTDAMSSSEFEDLPYKLKLSRAQYLGLDKTGNVKPDLDEDVYIRATPGMSGSEIEDSLTKEKKRREEALIQSLQREFGNNDDYCMHFFCHVIADDSGHGILITLVQKDRFNRALYIFDNLNMPITEDSENKKYIDFLCTIFGISFQESFNRYKIDIPDKWPTTPVFHQTVRVDDKGKLIEEKDYLELLVPLDMLLKFYKSNKYIPNYPLIEHYQFNPLPLMLFL